MAEDKKYNGWTNYETWNVKLWIDNEEGSYRFWQQSAQSCFDRATIKHETWNTISQQARFNLADRLKDEFEDSKPEVTGMWADLLGAAMSEVNWHEIANSLLEDVEWRDGEEKYVSDGDEA